MKNGDDSTEEDTVETKATRFVEAFLEAKRRILAKAPDDSPKDFMTEGLGIDKLSILAKKLLQLQSEFSKNGISDEVTIAYYYSRGNIGKKFGIFGYGIYTANNPVCFSENGKVGLLVAILKGRCTNCVKIVKKSKNTVWPRPGWNTFIGNRQKGIMRSGKSTEELFWDEIILKEAEQCLPLIQFSGSLLESQNPNFIGHELIFLCHLEMQEMLDQFFKKETKTEVKRDRIFPPSHLFPPNEEQKDTFKSPTILYTQATLGPSEMKKMKEAVLSKSKNPLLSNQEALVKAGFTFAESRDPFKQEHIIRAMKLRSPEKVIPSNSSSPATIDLLPGKESQGEDQNKSSDGSVYCVARMKEIVRQRISRIKLLPRKKQRRRRSSFSKQRRRSSASEDLRSSLTSLNSNEEDPELHSGLFC